MTCIAGFAHAENLVQNGDFRQTELADDIFDGVDKDGNLRVNTEDLPIMIEGSSQSTVYFGALVGVTMLGALGADLVLWPLLLTTLRPIQTENPDRGT